MFTFVLTIHFILCAALVGLVLIQQGKGADMGAAFGAGSSNSLFGASGANNLVVKITTFVAIAFMVTSIALINLSNSDAAMTGSVTATEQSLSGSVMEQVAEPAAPQAESQVSNEEAAPAADSVPQGAPQAETSQDTKN